MSDNPTEYAANLRARRAKVEPFVYQCWTSPKKVKFAMPLSLPAEAGEAVLGWMHRLEFDELGAIASALPVLRAWVGDEGYDLLIRQDKLTTEDVMNVLGDALQAYEGVTGTSGESPASTS